MPQTVEDTAPAAQPSAAEDARRFMGLESATVGVSGTLQPGGCIAHLIRDEQFLCFSSLP